MLSLKELKKMKKRYSGISCCKYLDKNVSYTDLYNDVLKVNNFCNNRKYNTIGYMGLNDYYYLVVLIATIVLDVEVIIIDKNIKENTLHKVLKRKKLNTILNSNSLKNILNKEKKFEVKEKKKQKTSGVIIYVDKEGRIISLKLHLIYDHISRLSKITQYLKKEENYLHTKNTISYYNLWSTLKCIIEGCCQHFLTENSLAIDIIEKIKNENIRYVFLTNQLLELIMKYCYKNNINLEVDVVFCLNTLKYNTMPCDLDKICKKIVCLYSYKNLFFPAFIGSERDTGCRIDTDDILYKISDFDYEIIRKNDNDLYGKLEINSKYNIKYIQDNINSPENEYVCYNDKNRIKIKMDKIYHEINRKIVFLEEMEFKLNKCPKTDKCFIYLITINDSKVLKCVVKINEGGKERDIIRWCKMKKIVIPDILQLVDKIPNMSHRENKEFIIKIDYDLSKINLNNKYCKDSLISYLRCLIYKERSIMIGEKNETKINSILEKEDLSDKICDDLNIKYQEKFKNINKLHIRTMKNTTLEKKKITGTDIDFINENTHQIEQFQLNDNLDISFLKKCFDIISKKYPFFSLVVLEKDNEYLFIKRGNNLKINECIFQENTLNTNIQSIVSENKYLLNVILTKNEINKSIIIFISHKSISNFTSELFCELIEMINTKKIKSFIGVYPLTINESDSNGFYSKIKRIFFIIVNILTTLVKNIINYREILGEIIKQKKVKITKKDTEKLVNYCYRNKLSVDIFLMSVIVKSICKINNYHIFLLNRENNHPYRKNIAQIFGNSGGIHDVCEIIKKEFDMNQENINKIEYITDVVLNIVQKKTLLKYLKDMCIIIDSNFFYNKLEYDIVEKYEIKNISQPEYFGVMFNVSMINNEININCSYYSRIKYINELFDMIVEELRGYSKK